MWLRPGLALSRRVLSRPAVRRSFADDSASKYPDPRIPDELFPANPQILIYPRVRNGIDTIFFGGMGVSLAIFLFAFYMQPETRADIWAREEAISMGVMPASEALRMLDASRTKPFYEHDKQAFRFLEAEKAAKAKEEGGAAAEAEEH